MKQFSFVSLTNWIQEIICCVFVIAIDYRNKPGLVGGAEGMGTVEFVTGIISFGGDKFSGELTIEVCGPIFAAGFRSSSLISLNKTKRSEYQW